MRALANRKYFLPLMGALIALARLALWAWGRSPYARFLGHHSLDEPRAHAHLRRRPDLNEGKDERGVDLQGDRRRVDGRGRVHLRLPSPQSGKFGEEEIPFQEEGLPTAVALRSSGLALMLSVAAYVLDPRWMRWSSLELPPGLRWSGRDLERHLCPSPSGSSAPSARI